MSQVSLITPLTLGRTDQPGSYNALLDTCCSEAQPTVLISWGLCLLDTPGEYSDLHHQSPMSGAAMGCDDGTIYLFHPARVIVSVPSPEKRRSLETTLLSRSPTPRASGSTSHSPSPSGSRTHLAPFNVTARLRAVSGLSKEKVEAPKNYVDFEDEPEKLKEILNGRAVKTKTVTDGLIPSLEKGIVIEKSNKSFTSSAEFLSDSTQRKQDPRLVVSTTTSPTFTPQSLSPPLSPSFSQSFSSNPDSSLTLRCHIFPAHFGPRHSIVAIKCHDNNRFLVCLQKTGHVYVFKTKDGSCVASAIAAGSSFIAPPSGMQGGISLYGTWAWMNLHVVDTGESTIILTSACSDTAATSSILPLNDAQDISQERARVTVFLLSGVQGREFGETTLQKVGEWSIDGCADSVGLTKEMDGSLTLFYISARRRLVTHSLQILPKMSVRHPESTSRSGSTVNLALQLSNPFKGLKYRLGQQASPVLTAEEPGRVELAEPADTGIDVPAGSSLRIEVSSVPLNLHVTAWSDQELRIFRHANKSFHQVCTCSIDAANAVSLLSDDSFAVSRNDRMEIYALRRVDANNDPVKISDRQVLPEAIIVSPEMVLSLPLDQTELQLSSFASSTQILLTRLSHQGQRCLECLSFDVPTRDSDSTSRGRKKPRVIWKARLTARERQPPIPQPRITCILPTEFDDVLVGCDDGHIGRGTLLTINSTDWAKRFSVISDEAINGLITGMHLAENDRTNERFVVSGADDGSIAFWALGSLKLLARSTVFITPLSTVVQMRDETVGRLRGCIMCVSEGGTMAVFAMEGFGLLYLIPGSSSPTDRLCIGEDNLLLIYADGRARLWDLKTLEFWRSMTLEKAGELLGQGGWFETDLQDTSQSSNQVLSTFCSTMHTADSASTVLVDFVKFASSVIPTSTVGQFPFRGSSMQPLDRLRLLLSLTLTPGIEEEIDVICKEKLGIEPSDTLMGFTSDGSASIISRQDAQDPWRVSPEITAARMLIIATLLRLCQDFNDLERYANIVISYYIAALSDAIGPSFEPPSLPYLAQVWTQSTGEIRQAAGTLFEVSVGRMSNEETIQLVEQWQHRLPCLQPEADKQSPPAALALLLSGFVAANQYSLLSSSTLTDIAKSVVIYLHDEQSPHRALAIELCSRGFDVWQHYVDAMEVLRALFALATSSLKDNISVHNIGQQARLAVLQIASGNTPLFMTTLSLDILHPHNVEHRRSIMQLVAFMIRKKPLVLFPNLPRLVEAVVKSLDPNSTANREAVLDTATEILGHVVKTYPTVDFHMTSQRLAVGTSEGPVVMYDLKTATRLYVLEGHQKRPTACSFSPDGRRLVTISLEEGVVLVWKVGSSFSSFFNPGAPPRQGHAGSAPFKTLPFNVGDEAKMTVAATLEWLEFEWVAERSVKLKIRNSTLTFST